ncbi:MAG: flagellar basal body rod protein FlgB [Rhodospirillales bacterium]|nr:flagellar basal body rod protein FlgB [Rhodospirillales bacterium]
MDLGKIPLFAATRKRMAWLSQRQEVLAQNIANADTPDYRPRDIEAFRFEKLVKRPARQLNMSVTSGGHLGGQRKPVRDFAARDERRPFETAPSGNGVVLEEQMAKANETSMTHKLATELYRKHLGMLRMALGSGH